MNGISGLFNSWNKKKMQNVRIKIDSIVVDTESNPMSLLAKKAKIEIARKTGNDKSIISLTTLFLMIK